MMKCKFNNLLVNGKKIALMALLVTSLNANAENRGTEKQTATAELKQKFFQNAGPLLLTEAVVVGLVWLFCVSIDNAAEKRMEDLKKQQKQR